jgi:CBS domain containing-hemolysin-like protein
VLGSTPIAQLNHELRLGLVESEDYETVAGFVLHHMKRIPRAGDRFTHLAATFVVEVSTDRSVAEVRVEMPGVPRGAVTP